MHIHRHIGVYRLLRSTLSLQNTEFVYHFLFGEPELHRALTDNMRAHLGLRGLVDDLGKPDAHVRFAIARALEPILGLAGKAADALNVLALSRALAGKPIPEPRSLRPHCRALIRGSPLARRVLKMENLEP